MQWKWLEASNIADIVCLKEGVFTAYQYLYLLTFSPM